MFTWFWTYLTYFWLNSTLFVNHLRSECKNYTVTAGSMSRGAFHCCFVPPHIHCIGCDNVIVQFVHSVNIYFVKWGLINSLVSGSCCSRVFPPNNHLIVIYWHEFVNLILVNGFSSLNLLSVAWDVTMFLTWTPRYDWSFVEDGGFKHLHVCSKFQ